MGAWYTKGMQNRDKSGEGYWERGEAGNVKTVVIEDIRPDNDYGLIIRDAGGGKRISG